jgi:ABC-type polysaccharide/polyol phosphate export permease
MGNYLGAIWRCRYFWLSLVKVDLRKRYRHSVIGMGWSLLHPIALTAILCVIFHPIFGEGVKQYAVFLMAGLACWNFIVTATVSGCQSFFQGESYIRQYPAPLAIYPLRTALGEMIHFLVALSLVLAMAWWLNGRGSVTAVCSLTVVACLFLVFGWSLATIAAFSNVCFQDTQHLCDVAFKILFYATPVMYEAQMLQNNHLAALVKYNPLVPFLELVRQPVLRGQAPSLSTFGAAALTTLLTTGFAALILARFERRLIFRL